MTDSATDLINGVGEGNYTYRSFPQYVKCPGCGFEGDTSIRRDSKPLDCCLFFCCVGCYNLVNLIKGKDYTCYTVTHYCPKCQKELGIYKPCMD
jgi:hypothetical protein